MYSNTIISHLPLVVPSSILCVLLWKWWKWTIPNTSSRKSCLSRRGLNNYRYCFIYLCDNNYAHAWLNPGHSRRGKILRPKFILLSWCRGGHFGIRSYEWRFLCCTQVSTCRKRKHMFSLIYFWGISLTLMQSPIWEHCWLSKNVFINNLMKI